MSENTGDMYLREFVPRCMHAGEVWSRWWYCWRDCECITCGSRQNQRLDRAHRLTLSHGGACGSDAARRRAAGAFDTFLNVQITVVLAMQLVLCCACASASLHWRASQGFARYHLQLTDFSEGAGPLTYVCKNLSTALVYLSCK